MRTRSKKRPRVDRADPPAPETPGAGVVDAVDAPVPVPVPADALRLVLERFDRLEDELRKSRAEHLETRRTLAELVRSIRPTFDVNEQVASLVFAHVRDVRSRLALAQVSTTWHKASKQASSLPKSLDFSGIPVTDWDTLCYGGCSQEVAYVLGFNGVLDLPDAHFHALLEQAGADLSDRKVQGVIGNFYDNADRDEKALKWYHLGARQGDSHCEYSIGDNYRNGYGVEINLDTALEWFEKAAAKGHAGAQVGIGDVNYTKERYEDAVTWFTKAADQGDAEAEHRLGYCYQFGNGVELNLDTALAWFEKAAAKGHTGAQVGIGVVSYTKERYEDAVTWFTKAADQHDTEAESWLGRCYQSGNGVEQNLDTALAWFEKAAAKGHADGQFGIGVVNYTKERYEEAVTWFTKAADQGESNAEFVLGDCYRFGNGLEINLDTALEWYEKAAAKGHAGAQVGIGIVNHKKERYEEAVTWFTKAADQGIADAELRLGYCYQLGNGVELNLDTAMEWYEKAAAKGHVNGQVNIGIVSYKKERYEEAVTWFTKAAEQHDADAERWLGHCYRFGNGVEQNFDTALEWYEKAAAKGHAGAQYGIGIVNYKKERYEEAVTWFTKAAAQGDTDAEVHLGDCYRKGRGVTRDIPKAIEWYTKAAEKVDTEAAESLRELTQLAAST